MARPLKYGEKTSVRSITIPDTMWDELPRPKSQWVVEAVRQMLEPTNPRTPGYRVATRPDEVEQVRAHNATLKP